MTEKEDPCSPGCDRCFFSPDYCGLAEPKAETDPSDEQWSGQDTSERKA